MSRTAKALIWTLIGIPILLMVLLFIAFQAYVAMLTPDYEFEEKPIPEAPDYSERSNWTGWPDKNNPADRLPAGESHVPYEDRPAAAFFLHPFTYGSTEHYLQSMEDEETKRGTDLGSTSIQASVFNDCCMVYAPRYRQSGLAFPEESLEKRLFDIGYSDVRNAFFYFLDEIGDEKPFILAGHSGGSSHLVRLLMEEISGTKFKDRLVAIYAIGNSIPEDAVKIGLPDIDICTDQFQLGCFISWDSYRADKSPSVVFEGDSESWNGTDYSGYESSKRICVNPISWTTDASLSKKSDHLGALPSSKQEDYGSISDRLPDLVKNNIAVYCSNDESNWLFVNADRDERLKTQGWFRFFEGNLHGYDYQYYWANIRQNARDRVNQFISLKDQQ